MKITNTEFAELQVLRASMQKDLRAAANAIGAAAEMGDLSENSEFDAAKESRERVIERIRVLDEIIASCEMVDDTSLPSDRVTVGKKVSIYFYNMDQEKTFHVRVYPVEDNHLSVASPIGQIIMHKQVGFSGVLKNGSKFEIRSINV